jgi:hypothetical protein
VRKREIAKAVLSLSSLGLLEREREERERERERVGRCYRSLLVSCSYGVTNNKNGGGEKGRRGNAAEKRYSP